MVKGFDLLYELGIVSRGDSGLSKFSGSRQVVGEVWKEVFFRRNLACGTHYGSGMFCLTEAGEQQI